MLHHCSLYPLSILHYITLHNITCWQPATEWKKICQCVTITNWLGQALTRTVYWTMLGSQLWNVQHDLILIYSCHQMMLKAQFQSNKLNNWEETLSWLVVTKIITAGSPSYQGSPFRRYIAHITEPRLAKNMPSPARVLTSDDFIWVGNCIPLLWPWKSIYSKGSTMRSFP